MLMQVHHQCVSECGRCKAVQPEEQVKHRAAIKVISRLGIERETHVIVVARREQPAKFPHGIHAIVCREDILRLPIGLRGSDQRITHTTGHDPVRYRDIAVSIWSTRANPAPNFESAIQFCGDP